MLHNFKPLEVRKLSENDKNYFLRSSKENETMFVSDIGPICDFFIDFLHHNIVSVSLLKDYNFTSSSFTYFGGTKSEIAKKFQISDWEMRSSFPFQPVLNDIVLFTAMPPKRRLKLWSLCGIFIMICWKALRTVKYKRSFWRSFFAIYRIVKSVRS